MAVSTEPAGAPRNPVVIACGALARELRAVFSASGISERVEVRYLAANLHNTPDRITDAVREALVDSGAGEGRRSFVAYGDCGTGGAIDRMLADFPQTRRLEGAHCYEFFAGPQRFAALHQEAPGTFYLTDYLALHFDALVWDGLGLREHPELRDAYFAHYTRVVLLTQTGDPVVTGRARLAATRLGLTFESIVVGRNGLDAVVAAVTDTP